MVIRLFKIKRDQYIRSKEWERKSRLFSFLWEKFNQESSAWQTDSELVRFVTERIDIYQELSLKKI